MHHEVSNRMNKAVAFASIAAQYLGDLQDKTGVVNAMLELKASVEEQLISYRPSMKQDEQIEAHAHWTYLHGQLALLDQILQYLLPSTPTSNITPTSEDI